jgi:hypothetical protein
VRSDSTGVTADMHIISQLSDAPEACVMLSSVLFLASHFMVYMLLDGLLKMHRSKTAVKKLKKEYTFLQKLFILPFENHCLHAVRFCKGLIWFHRFKSICFLVFLGAAVLLMFGFVSDLVLAWMSVGMFVCFDVPEIIVNGIVSRPFIGRFKEYSFEKFHNTQDHESLV